MLLMVNCSKSYPPIDQNFIEEIIIANVIHDNEYIKYHLLGSSGGTSELTLFSEREIEELKQMLASNYISAISYDGDKATVVVNIADSGIIEWYNVNKLLVNPDLHVNLMRIKIIYFQYKSGRWWLIDYRPTNMPRPLGWPDPEALLDQIGV